MLTESEFVDAVRSMIRSQSINAESAISQAEKNFTQIYSSGTDVYMQAHVADVQEIARILLRTLRQKKPCLPAMNPVSSMPMTSPPARPSRWIPRKF